LDLETITEAVAYDKKFTGKKNKFILLKAINKPFFYYGLKRSIIIDSIKKNMG